MMKQPPEKKWEWIVSASLREATADQIWPFLKNFFNIHNWFPGMPTSYGVHGTNGEVGCIRYCAGFSIPSVDGSTGWSTERLTAVDPVERMIRYEISDCNIGFKNYISRIRICDAIDGGGCVMQWSVSVDPIGGSRMEEMVSKYEAVLKVWLKNMEYDALGRNGKSV